MRDHDESREEWEKELIDVQRGITFDQGRRRAEIITRKLSATPAPIADFAHLVMLLFSAALLVVAFVVFSSDSLHKTRLSIAIVAASCGLVVGAVRWRRKQR